MINRHRGYLGVSAILSLCLTASIYSGTALAQEKVHLSLGDRTGKTTSKATAVGRVKRAYEVRNILSVEDYTYKGKSCYQVKAITLDGEFVDALVGCK